MTRKSEMTRAKFENPLLTTAEGVQRSFSRTGDVPRVEIRDPLDAHRRLLGVYRDRDIHDVTAYLVTIK